MFKCAITIFVFLVLANVTFADVTIPLYAPFTYDEKWMAGGGCNGKGGGYYYNVSDTALGTTCKASDLTHKEYYYNGMVVLDDRYAVDFNLRVDSNGKSNSNDDGLPILAAHNGTIEFADWSKGYGWNVLLRSNEDPTYVSRYAHLKFDPKIDPGIILGDTVGHGETIGKSGSSGGEWPNHLHFVLYKDGMNSVAPTPMSKQQLTTDSSGVLVQSDNVPNSAYVSRVDDKNYRITFNELTHINPLATQIKIPEAFLGIPIFCTLIEEPMVTGKEPSYPMTLTLSETVSSFFTANLTLLNGAKIDVSYPFMDVPYDHQFAKAIFSLYKLGTVKGKSEGFFKPEDSVSRIEALAMLLNAAITAKTSSTVELFKLAHGHGNLVDVLKFIDASSIPDWGMQYVQIALKFGFISEASLAHKQFRPNDAISRPEFAVMLVRVFENIVFGSMKFKSDVEYTRTHTTDYSTISATNPTFGSALAKLFSSEVMNGYRDTSNSVTMLRILDGGKPIKRGEAAALVFKTITK